MPLYEYKCPNGHLTEVFHGMTEPKPEKCEVCGKPTARVFHAPAVHFKGSGFYNTDYGTKKRQREKAASDSSSSEKSSGDSSKSDSSTSDGSKSEAKSTTTEKSTS